MDIPSYALKVHQLSLPNGGKSVPLFASVRKLNTENIDAVLHPLV